MNDKDENIILRRLLWLRHGCPPHGLYGDDGEMQCSVCMIDFLRDSADRIEQRFIEINEPKLAEFLKTIKKEQSDNELQRQLDEKRKVSREWIRQKCLNFWSGKYKKKILAGYKMDVDMFIEDILKELGHEVVKK